MPMTSFSHALLELVLSIFLLELHREFAMKDLSTLNYFLGIKATLSNNGFYLTHATYIHDLLARDSMLECKLLNSLMASGAQLSAYDGKPFDDPYLYCSLVGSLRYLTLTRPNITFAVNQVCQFMHRPSFSKWAAIKRILQYLKGLSLMNFTLSLVQSLPFMDSPMLIGL